MNIKKVVKLFENNSVCVSGLKGRGKDVLFGNVIARQLCPYISNVDYTRGFNYQGLDFKKLDINNSYMNFINGCFNKFSFPYKKASDIFISDSSIYFASQNFALLNKRFDTFPIYLALSRQISNNHIHINVQNLNRVWDKFRELSDIYINCNWCKFFGNVVVMSITIYDKYESALNRVKPFHVSKPLINKESKTMVDLGRDNHFNLYGSVKKRLLIFKNKSFHDTLYFGKLLEKGC